MTKPSDLAELEVGRICSDSPTGVEFGVRIMFLDDNKISDSPNWTFISDISEGSDDILDGRTDGSARTVRPTAIWGSAIFNTSERDMEIQLTKYQTKKCSVSHLEYNCSLESKILS